MTEAVEPYRNFDKIKQDLAGFWTLDWGSMVSSLIEMSPSEEQKEELSKLALQYAEGALRAGQFGNLIGIDPLLEFLGIDSIEFTGTHMENILNLYSKYSLTFLYSMAPDLVDSKLRDGREYKKIEYVRSLLERRGATPEELTDEYIKNLWDAREILVKLHQNRGFDPKALSSSRKKIGEFVRLLT